jgi:hypothetical protein
LICLPSCISHSRIVPSSPAREDVRIVAPRETGDRGGVAGERLVPRPDAASHTESVAVAVAGREQDAVGAERHGGHPVGVLLQEVDALAFGRHHLHELVGRPERDGALVGAEIRGEDRIVLIPHLEEAPTARDVPADHAAERRAAPAARDQRLPVAAELDALRQPFGKGQDATAGLSARRTRPRMNRAAPAAAARREERRPRICRQRFERARPRARHDRLEHEVLRARRRPRRLADRDERGRGGSPSSSSASPAAAVLGAGRPRSTSDRRSRPAGRLRRHGSARAGAHREVRGCSLRARRDDHRAAARRPVITPA